MAGGEAHREWFPDADGDLALSRERSPGCRGGIAGGREVVAGGAEVFQQLHLVAGCHDEGFDDGGACRAACWGRGAARLGAARAASWRRRALAPAQGCGVRSYAAPHAALLSPEMANPLVRRPQCFMVSHILRALWLCSTQMQD